MLRIIAIGSLAAALPGCLPAHAQEIPQLEGGPGSRAAEQNALKAEQARLARQADELARQAEDLKALEARLKAREVELAAQAKRLVQLEIEQKRDNAAALAALVRETEEAGEEESSRSQTADRSTDTDDSSAVAGRDAADEVDDGLGPQPETPRALYARLDFDAAQRSCSRAAEDAALARNFHSARYDSEPRLYQDEGWQMFGWMRLTDRRGYVVVRTVCALDDAGEVLHFGFMR